MPRAGRSASKSSRSPTALAGIDMLKRGSKATKYTRNGVPRETTFRLSDDEQTLSWDGGHGGLTAPIKMARGERRSIKITEVLEMMLGMESKIFSLHRDQTGMNEHPMAHVSMTLVLVGSLPSFPGEEDDMERTKNFNLRETLDLSFKDEEVFGLWVAALRALMYETEPVFFTKVASPLNNVNASAIASIRQKAPPDASCGELMRDLVLHAQLSKCSEIMNIVWIICVAGCGTWWASSIIGFWNAFYIVYDGPFPCDKCTGYNATRDGPWYMEKTDWANVAIQIVRGLLTYQGLVMVGPWRFSNLWHLTCSRRESEAGHDLYGRATDDASVWFHIEKKKRLRVTLYLIGNIVFQIFLQIAAAVYYSYELDQSAAGVLIGISCMLLSIGCAVAGAYWQTHYEHELHVNDPDRFPPNPLIHAKEQFDKKRNKRRARQSVQKEVEFMRSNRMSFIGAASCEEGAGGHSGFSAGMVGPHGGGSPVHTTPV